MIPPGLAGCFVLEPVGVFHCLAGAVERLRDGWAFPASERTFLGAPLPGFCLVTGAAGEAPALLRGKSPVACGKSSAGMSAPPLMRWQSRQ
jgi:hypothetical protein